MFWKFNQTSSPHIETLLNKDDVTLHELMEEEDILQECKVQNKKLIDYLLRPEVMEELVTLTTVEPCDDVDERSRYKYPNIACELLTCDVPALNERLAGDEALLNKLYSFLETDPPLNPLLASFFSKILGVLVTRKSDQNWYSYQFTCLQVLEFLKSKEDCISLLLKHVGTSAIMDLLLKLITHVEGVEMRQNILNWLDSQQIVQRLIALLDPSVDADRHCNVSQLLCDVIRASRENLHSNTDRADPDPVLNTLESSETVTQLLDHIFSGEKSESCIVGGIGILLALIDLGKPSTSNDSNTNPCNNSVHDENGSGENERALSTVYETVMSILPRLKDLHNLLLDPPQKAPIKTTIETLDPPLGTTRLQVAKLISALVATNISEVNKELANLGTVEVLLDLFFKYTWNNFLHTQVEQCIGFALNSGLNVICEDDSHESTLLTHIFSKCRLIQRIVDAWDENDAQQSKPGGQRKGYMGHLIKIANHVVQQADKSPYSDVIKQQISSLPEDRSSKWDTFVANTLSEINKKHGIALGGVHPGHSSSEDDDGEYQNIPFSQDAALQQVFSDYQMQQMAPQFIEHYGFHDDEFTDGEDVMHSSVDRLTSMTFNFTEDELGRQAEIFKQVCAQKIHPLDDNDEDIWDDREQELTFQNVIGAKARNQHETEDCAENSSSDEDERAGPEGKEVGMEIDSSDGWPAPETTTPVEAPVAMDTANPWSNAEGGSEEQSGWADFSSPGFADFEANFGGSEPQATGDHSKKENADEHSEGGSGNCSNSPSNVPATDGEKEAFVQKESEGVPVMAASQEDCGNDVSGCGDNSQGQRQSETVDSELVESDDNANPSSLPVKNTSNNEAEELMDNYRFLATQGLMTSGTTCNSTMEGVPAEVDMEETSSAQEKTASEPLQVTKHEQGKGEDSVSNVTEVSPVEEPAAAATNGPV